MSSLRSVTDLAANQQDFWLPNTTSILLGDGKTSLLMMPFIPAWAGQDGPRYVFTIATLREHLEVDQFYTSAGWEAITPAPRKGEC